MTGPGSGRQPPHTSHNLTFADTIPRIGADMVLTRVIEGLAHGKTDQAGGGRSRNRQPRRLRLGRRDQGLCPAHRAGGTKSYVLNSRAGRDRNAPQHHRRAQLALDARTGAARGTSPENQQYDVSRKI